MYILYHEYCYTVAQMVQNTLCQKTDCYCDWHVYTRVISVSSNTYVVLLYLVLFCFISSYCFCLMLMCLVQLWLGHCFMTSLSWCLSLGYLSSHQSKNQEKETKTSLIQTGNGLAWKYKREELVKTIVEIFIYYLCINIFLFIYFIIYISYPSLPWIFQRFLTV